MSIGFEKWAARCDDCGRADEPGAGLVFTGERWSYSREDVEEVYVCRFCRGIETRRRHKAQETAEASR